MYSCLKVNNNHKRQANGTKTWVIKQKIQFWDYTKSVKHIEILVIIEVDIFSIHAQLLKAVFFLESKRFPKLVFHNSVMSF